MSGNTKPALIGAFVLAALTLLATGVYYMGAGRFGTDRLELVLYFRNDISGLNVGAPVVLKGVRVGAVSAIQVEYHATQNSVLVPVTIRVNQDAVVWPGQQPDITDDQLLDLLVERGLRGRLILQSFVTGLLMLELGFFPDTPARFQLSGEARAREIPTIPSELDQLKRTLTGLPLEQIATSLSQVLQGADRLINDPEARALLHESRRAAAQIRELAENLNQRVDPLDANLNDGIGDVRRLATTLKREVEAISGDIRRMTEAISALTLHLDDALKPLIPALRAAARAAERGFGAAGAAFDEASAMLRPDSPLQTELLRTLRDAADAARSLRNMADYLERHPEALLRGKH